MRKTERGFTLVELSIVLVIIGLLIGGILAAQSMISTAKITSFIAQIGRIDAEVEAFKSKYNYLPGDAPQFSGDGNGILACQKGGGADGEVDVYGGEVANFWGDLEPQLYITYPGIECGSGGMISYTSGPHTNVPLSKLGSNGSFIIATSVLTYPSWTAVANINYYLVLPANSINGGNSSTPCNDPWAGPGSWCRTYGTEGNLGAYNSGFGPTNSAVTAQDLQALDVKMDDGIANTGNVMAERFYGMTPMDLTYPWDYIQNCNPNGGPTYNTSNPNSQYPCTPMIRIGASLNDPD